MIDMRKFEMCSGFVLVKLSSLVVADFKCRSAKMNSERLCETVRRS